MLGNMLSIATAALRSTSGGSGLGAAGIRPINPVVRGADGTQLSNPAPRTPDADRTRYTPSEAPNPQNDLYNRKGGLNATGYQAASQSIKYERNATFDLSIDTADGDTATIRISQQESESANFGATRASGSAGQASALALDINRTESLSVQIGVQGNLSDEETAAINALVSKVNSVADDFFEGNLEEATQAASQIAFGPGDDSLSAYSFSLQSHESLRAVTHYESVAAAGAIPSEPSARAIDVPPPPRPAAAAGLNILDLPKLPELRTEAKPKAGFLQSLRAMLNDVTQGAKALAA